MVSESFLLETSEDRNLSIYYAPVEYFNEHATVLIVGITPGINQMKKAYASVLNNKDRLKNNEQLLHEAKKASSYEGTMRKNLIHMLDELELQRYLGLSSSAELFTAANHFVHTTGILPYPVFYKGKNFTGSTPAILKNKMLKRYVMECFVSNLSRLNNPLVIPLGVNVSNVLRHLLKSGLFNATHILTGFPHPSGANGHRHKQFANHKERMRKEIADYFQK
ncbi:hypothetical protein [Pueribacillus theae]|nr:hypothetical protein [Pueribacillus theae]